MAVSHPTGIGQAHCLNHASRSPPIATEQARTLHERKQSRGIGKRRHCFTTTCFGTPSSSPNTIKQQHSTITISDILDQTTNRDNFNDKTRDITIGISCFFLSPTVGTTLPYPVTPHPYSVQHSHWVNRHFFHLVGAKKKGRVPVSPWRKAFQ